MPGEILYIYSLVETMRVVSTVLMEKVKHRPYPVMSSIRVVEFERKGEKSGGGDSPVGLKKRRYVIVRNFWIRLWCGI